MAERNGPALRRRLASAERLSEAAIAFGSLRVKTSCSRSSASLLSVTCCDHFFVPPIIRVPSHPGSVPPPPWIARSRRRRPPGPEGPVRRDDSANVNQRKKCARGAPVPQLASPPVDGASVREERALGIGHR